MTWEYNLTEVFVLYFKLGVICAAYMIAKMYTARNRSSAKPPVAERLLRYAGCVAAVSVVAFFASGKYDDDDHVIGIDYNRGARVFLMLVIPALIGANAGFTTKDDFSHHTDSNDHDM